jgi:predicted ferric reductase
MRRALRSNIIIYSFTALPVVLLIIGNPSLADLSTYYAVLTILAKITAFSGLALLAITVVLSSRIKTVDRILGGLDTVYEIHHDKGKIAFVLLFLHPIFLALREVDQLLPFIKYFLPGSGLAIDLGKIALTLMAIALLISIYIEIDYEVLKKIHRSLGLFMVLGGFHAYLTRSNLYNIPILRYYMMILLSISTLLYLNTSLFGNILAKKFKYRVRGVARLSETITKITMEPDDEALEFKPGQFILIRFKQENFDEIHPFSIVSSPEEDNLSICVKKLGDYTSRMHELEENTLAIIEGAYGGFLIKRTSREQILIAGGIGLTPFLSMLSAINQQKLSVHLYYSYGDPGDDSLVDLIRERIMGDSVKLSVIDTREIGRITVERIIREYPDFREKSYCICGPSAMNRDFEQKLREAGVPIEQIDLEYFKLL